MYEPADCISSNDRKIAQILMIRQSKKETVRFTKGHLKLLKVESL